MLGSQAFIPLNSLPKLVVKKIASDNFTPISVLQNAEVLLESAYAQTGRERYSMMILESAFCIEKDNGVYYMYQNGQTHNLSKLDKSKKFLDWIEYFKNLAPQSDDIDFPLPLGGIGYIGYEFFSEIEEIEFSSPKLIGIPECKFVFGRDFLIFDHLYDIAYICSVNYACDANDIDLDSRIKTIEKSLLNLTPHKPQARQYDIKIISKNKAKQYKENVRILKDEIFKGNLLQCVPSQSMQIKTNLPPLEAYINLRHTNPSPYMFYFNFQSFVLFGASPEVMIKLQDSTLTIRPIAGTRHRGENIAEDLNLERELLDDEKENAEHLMLLDLARNDIGKIAIPGSVKVTKNRIIERYSSVMHIVSEVQGEIKPNLNFKDAIYATFPAGTISGAPKIQAIKTLQMLETHKREAYSGMIAYINRNGDLDSAITIRSAVYKDNIYYLQAGAGIVYDSNEDFEFQETLNKMQALFESITKTSL